MRDIEKVQKKILKDLYKRDIKLMEVKINTDSYILKESDEITKVRELIFHIDKLIEYDLIIALDNYYIESDKMSFKYMNSGVEIIENRINISALGIKYIEGYFSGGVSFDDNIIKNKFGISIWSIFSHIVALLLGMLLMFIVMKYIN